MLSHLNISSIKSDMLPPTITWPGLCAGAAILALTYIYFRRSLSNTAEEPAVDYTVPIPEQCKPGWRGEELEEVQLKVRDLSPFAISQELREDRRLTQDRQSPGSSAIQCYCPANGRSLGLVNPATPDGINRAVARATEAQVQWAKTSFGQRRRVLRTLLKYGLRAMLYPAANLSTLSGTRLGNARLTEWASQQVYPRAPRGYSHGGVSRLRQDADRCLVR